MAEAGQRKAKNGKFIATKNINNKSARTLKSGKNKGDVTAKLKTGGSVVLPRKTAQKLGLA
jgi:hypothetical protein